MRSLSETISGKENTATNEENYSSVKKKNSRNVYDENSSEKKNAEEDDCIFENEVQIIGRNNNSNENSENTLNENEKKIHSLWRSDSLLISSFVSSLLSVCNILPSKNSNQVNIIFL